MFVLTTVQVISDARQHDLPVDLEFVGVAVRLFLRLHVSNRGLAIRDNKVVTDGAWRQAESQTGNHRADYLHPRRAFRRHGVLDPGQVLVVDLLDLGGHLLRTLALEAVRLDGSR